MTFINPKLKIVALGGGHGLSASLRALKTITSDLTAIVGVSDNGGSSGRLRAEFDVIPPGDLRMALIALCSDSEHGRMWADVLQHRFSGDGHLSGHAVGNLLITSLWQQNGDIISGLDAVCDLLEAQGRVLPLSLQPLDVVADVEQSDGELSTVFGQVAVATAPGTIKNLRFEQKAAKACSQAIEAINSADVIVMGPGSWYTSVANHLLLKDLANALVEAKAKKILITNLSSQTGETQSFTPARHLAVLHDMAPRLKFDLIVVDTKNASPDFDSAAEQISENVLVADVCKEGSLDTHDSTLLAEVLSTYLELSTSKEG
jgi:uncharacterized cofD-like protein